MDSVMWSSKDHCKSDEEYKMLVGYHHSSVESLEDVRQLNSMLKHEFDLTHDIRWVGIVSTFKTPGVACTGGRRDAFFLVHEEDVPKISNGKRIDMGFRWWFDILLNGATRLYPLKFRRMYPA